MTVMADSCAEAPGQLDITSLAQPSSAPQQELLPGLL